MAHVTIASRLAVDKKQAKPDFLYLREKGKAQQTSNLEKISSSKNITSKKKKLSSVIKLTLYDKCIFTAYCEMYLFLLALF